MVKEKRQQFNNQRNDLIRKWEEKKLDSLDASLTA